MIIGEWSKPNPQCVRPGCDMLQSPEYGRLDYDLDGALALFSCNENMQLSGESVLGCDGQTWNASAPMCIMTTTPKPERDGAWTSDGSSALVTSNTALFCISILMMYKLAFQ